MLDTYKTMDDIPILTNGVNKNLRLYQCEYTGGSLYKVIFRQCTFMSCYMTKIDLSMGMFNYTTLNGMCFDGMTMPNMVFSKSQIISPMFTESSVDYCLFEDVDIFDFEVEKSEFCHSIFTSGKIIKARISKSDFSFVHFKKIDLEDFEIRECLFTGSIMRNLKMPHFKAEKCDLTKAKFRKSELISARFEETLLMNADLRETDLTGADFIKCDLKNMKLGGANIWRTNFINNTNIEQVDFGGVILLRTMSVQWFGGLLMTSVLGGVAIKIENRAWAGDQCFKNAFDYYYNEDEGDYSAIVILNYMEAVWKQWKMFHEN